MNKTHPDRQTPPPVKPIADLTLATPTVERLRNGIPLYMLHNGQMDLIHILIRIRAGILHEPQKHIAHFTYSLLKESSPTLSATETANLLDYHGAHVSYAGALDSGTITISAPAGNIPRILPVIFDFIAHPQFRQERLEVFQNLKIKDLEYSRRKTDVRSTQLLLHTLFGDGYTAGQFSTRENLRAVTVGQMQDFHRRTFRAGSITLFLTGNITPSVGGCVRDLFGQVPEGAAPPAIRDLDLPADPARIVAEEMPGCVQSSISLCLVRPGYASEDRRGFSFLSTLTGGYFGSRLMQSLRERKGFTYGVSAGSVYFGNQSLFIINSDVNAAHTQAAIDTCFEELRRLQEEPVGAEELESVRNYLLGDLIREVDNSVSYMKKYALWNSFGLDEREFQAMARSIREMDAEALRTLVKRHFNHNNFTQIIVGDVRNLTKA